MPATSRMSAKLIEKGCDSPSIISPADYLEDDAVADKALRGDRGLLVQTSIAISLKRIADALHETNEYGEFGSQALAGTLARGLRDR